MPNSNTLNLLSDSTFGDKLDEQNAILEDIKDNMGGGNLAGTIATIETSPAAAAHAVGEYIYYNTKLYKVTAAIALGDTLTVGTNIAETKVMNEIPSVTTSIASGSTDVPTSGAVYNAIQSAGGGIEFLTPKPGNQASATDDIIISESDTSVTIAANSYTITGKYIKNSNYYHYLWVKLEIFGATSIEELTEHMILTFLNFGTVGTGSSSTIGIIDSVDTWTVHNGYAVIRISGKFTFQILKV